MIRSIETKEKTLSARPGVQLKAMKDKPVSVIGKVLFVSEKKQEPVKIVVPGVTFSDDKLPMEGTEHNKALYLTVKCEGSMVSWALIDNGSSANICTLSTLNKLKIDEDRIRKNNICVRRFDGGGTNTVGDIVLELTIGPVEFMMEFQVLDAAVSYNLLLGRPWIHAAKAMPSTLHQVVKFEWD
ncbi:uncharacterized protein [Nicotiana sylvestris]|uniref:uncharacterized protein n=1 Tax=Nicotiana sylvestris TaxID=4096 RepID=UPI00388C7BF5